MCVASPSLSSFPLLFLIPNGPDPLATAFGAAGGYLAGSHALISSLRQRASANVYGEATPPVVLAQIVSSMSIILGDRSLASQVGRERDWGEGTERLRRLAFNARYLRRGLKELGFMVYGHRDSPIVPCVPLSQPESGQRLTRNAGFSSFNRASWHRSRA